MIENITEDNWPEGWIPSSSSQADFGAPSRGLLRMDNLTLDEKGSLRLANRPTLQSAALGYTPHSIYAAFVNALKLRYIYDAVGTLHRNYGGAVSLTIYDLTLGTGGTTLKAGFLNALGHVIALAGSLQIKDRGDVQWPLQIPQPAPPVLTNEAAAKIDLNNLDGSSNYTNWTDPSSSAFSNAGTTVTITANITTGVAAFQTVYGSVVDTTNFGLTGEDNPADVFSFAFEIDDPTQLNYLRIDFYCTDPGSGPVTDSFYAEYDFTTVGTIYSSTNNAPIGATVYSNTPRSRFIRQGTTGSLGWNTIKAARLTIGTIQPTNCTFSQFFVGSGAVLGEQTYLAVEVNDTGQFVQYSIASAQVVVNASINFIQVDRSGTACNAQCNGIRFFRNNTILGQFIEVARQTGAYGFTPISFIDAISDNTALADAAIDTSKVLNYFRVNLPTNIIGAIWFASRVIYLTTNSFFPSFQLDLGSYDGRFNYELLSTNSERCLFVTKLSIGTFIVATTVDFYQITGTFALVNIANADGTSTVTQDVNILPLGISDPAINSSFFEVEGNIFYMSSRGLRSMSNGTSTLLNTTTDLLFRNEERYGFPPVALQPNDLSLIGMVASGTRIYLGLPFSNGQNAVLVSTYNPPNAADLRGSNYWRPLTMAALCMCRELDGTVLYGDQTGFIGSLEDSFTGVLPIDFMTQFNFGQHPTQTKTIGSQLIYINTGGNSLTLIINGLKEDGSIVTFTAILNAATPQIKALDPHSQLAGCIAYQTQIVGNTNTFELNYIIMLVVEEYPALTFYALVPFSNLGKDTLKKLAKWPFVLDTLGNSITVKVTADNTVVSSQLEAPVEPQGIVTKFWLNVADLAALDWQIELIAPSGMHFFNFMKPDILQIYPPGRILDQIGPLDLDRSGIAFSMRLRVISEGTNIVYKVLDNDVVTYENNIIVIPGLDTTYEETFPKGINTSVLRVLLSSNQLFYRFSLEFKVRLTGKETEEKWIKV